MIAQHSMIFFLYQTRKICKNNDIVKIMKFIKDISFLFIYCHSACPWCCAFTFSMITHTSGTVAVISEYEYTNTVYQYIAYVESNNIHYSMQRQLKNKSVEDLIFVKCYPEAVMLGLA